MPSMVVTSRPSAWTASTVHDLTASPSSHTVHAPQFEVSQPTCVPVRFSCSRRKWTSSVRGSTSAVRGPPFTVMVTALFIEPSSDVGDAHLHRQVYRSLTRTSSRPPHGPSRRL